ncbi:hypothetical protein PWL12_002483 [Salmonella enterica]|jgi:hypothetical protein|nr:hypothetical protein [Salmonella enterica subsp. enterica serovar Heidelberg]ECE8180667.1 hypothetical protein [Salmonella enterica subsp. enterica serovar Enteritidis]EKN1663330.1 hypothetical protein [Salmonella enterica]ELH2353412.1 hypothetical protein [Salmonella enterica]
MSGIEELENGMKRYTFEDGTVLTSTTNELADLVPDHNYFVMGNEKVYPGGEIGILFKWFVCDEITDDERYEHVSKAMFETGEIEHTGRVRVLSNDGHAVELEWIASGRPRQKHYYNGSGITTVAESLN